MMESSVLLRLDHTGHVLAHVLGLEQDDDEFRKNCRAPF